MKIEILDDDLTKRIYDVSELEKCDQDVLYVDSKSKEDSILQIIRAYKSGKKQVLFDESHQNIKELLKKIDLEDIDFSMLLFTSGTTGKPVGAFKSMENLEEEIKQLAKLVKRYNPKKIISTVPFVHIYGILTSVLLPYRIDIDLFFKKHFLPHDLLESIEPNSIVATTPLYIKSLLRLQEIKDLKDVLFISSTAPLDAQSAKKFIKKFNTNLIQIFGSTETGGIAYKKQEDELWRPIYGVKAEVNGDSLLKISSPFVSKLLYENGFKKTFGVIQSFDYVEFDGDRFRIVGRNSQIFKVGGKRFSTLYIEEVLESLSAIKKAYVTITYDKDQLKDESLDIYLESDKNIGIKEINKAIKKKIGNMKIPIKLKIVGKIPTTKLGKKMMPF